MPLYNTTPLVKQKALNDEYEQGYILDLFF